MKKCEVCNANNDDHTQYCISCKYPLLPVEQDEYLQILQKFFYDKISNLSVARNNTKNLLIIVITCFLSCVLGLLRVHALRMGKQVNDDMIGLILFLGIIYVISVSINIYNLLKAMKLSRHAPTILLLNLPFFFIVSVYLLWSSNNILQESSDKLARLQHKYSNNKNDCCPQ